MADTPNKVLDRWQTSALYWEKYRTVIAQFFAPLTAALVEQAGITAGLNVLDIGGGSGEPSLTIASIVGPNGSVTYTDPIEGMVASAQAEAQRRGLTNIQFKQCPGDALPFSDNTFDVAVGRLSVMFFPDPAAGIREILRVIRHGGNLSLVVWAAKEVNPFFSAVTDVIDRFVPVDPPDPDEPDAFRFAAPGKLAGIMERAGGQDVRETQRDFRIEGAMGFEQFWKMRTEMSDTLREKLAVLSSDQLPAVKQAVNESTRKYFTDETMSFPAQVMIVTGWKFDK